MPDVHSKEVRSYNMSKIKGKDTKPELVVRKYLFARGFRYRLNVSKLPGKPDIVLPKYKTVVFVNGCFWHGHNNCKYFVKPKTRKKWWTNKLSQNIKRDKLNYQELKSIGWNIVIIYECELKKVKKDKTLKTLMNKLKNQNN